jgi:hypothetical protein
LSIKIRREIGVKKLLTKTEIGTKLETRLMLLSTKLRRWMNHKIGMTQKFGFNLGFNSSFKKTFVKVPISKCLFHNLFKGGHPIL